MTGAERRGHMCRLPLTEGMRPGDTLQCGCGRQWLIKLSEGDAKWARATVLRKMKRRGI